MARSRDCFSWRVRGGPDRLAGKAEQAQSKRDAAVEDAERAESERDALVERVEDAEGMHASAYDALTAARDEARAETTAAREQAVAAEAKGREAVAEQRSRADKAKPVPRP
ncbi:hypothetical protein ACX80E_03135 [Arthrobacter sp. TMN-49]